MRWNRKPDAPRTGSRFAALRTTRWALVAAAALATGTGWLLYTGGPRPALRAAVLAAPAFPVTDWRLPLTNGREWLNSAPLKAEDLRGKVVLVNFWTYSCINSLRPLPYVRAWAKKYGDRGLVVVGVHTPEFGFEKDVVNVRRALAGLGVRYPVVLDSDFAIWNAYGNSAWPAFYFIDAKGQVRRRTLGEGGYADAERLIQALLSEAEHAPVTAPITEVAGVGPEAAPDWNDIDSPETYVGYDKAVGFASDGGVRKDQAVVYRPPARPSRNRWGLAGEWKVGGEFATVTRPAGAITYRFHARDLNLVLAPPPDGRAIRFRVRVDGGEPSADHGYDTDARGLGRLDEPRMYQLVRQRRSVTDRTFEIQFLDAGARAYVFTFG